MEVEWLAKMYPVCWLSPTTGVMGRAILAQLSSLLLLAILQPECDIFTQEPPLGSWSQTHDQGQPAQSTGATGLPFVPGGNALSKLRMAALQTPLLHGALGGTQQEKSRSGLGGPQMQSGDGNCHPTAQRWALAEPSSQERLQPTYQHPRHQADDATPLPSLPGSLPSPQAQPVLTFKQSVCQPYYTIYQAVGYYVQGKLTTAIKLRLGSDKARIPGHQRCNIRRPDYYKV